MSKNKLFKKQCVAGCQVFTGWEVKHHKDCPYYKGSLSEDYDRMKKELGKLQKEQ